MEKSRTAPPHHRLRELLAIPERDRTEAEWAELNELEITLTPVNRAEQKQNARRKGPASTTQPANTAQPKSREGTHAKQALKKPRKRPPRGGRPPKRMEYQTLSESSADSGGDSFFRIWTDLLNFRGQ